MKRSPLTLTIALVLIVVFGLLVFTYQVRKSEVAVVARFGRVVRQQTDPGLGFRWPYPIEQVYKLDQRIQNLEGKFETIKLTGQTILMLEVYVGWHIDDPKVFFPNFAGGSISVAEDRLEELVRNAKNEVAGKHVFSDFVSSDAKQMKFGEIEAEILSRLQGEVSSRNYGLAVDFVRIKKIGLPETVTQAVFDRMTSERQTYVSQIQSSGEEIANKIKSKANSDASKLIADADAEAFRIRAEGEAKMLDALQVFQQDTNLATFILQETALEEMLTNRTTLILDQSTAPLNLLQPLPPQKFDTGKSADGK